MIQFRVRPVVFQIGRIQSIMELVDIESAAARRRQILWRECV